VQNCDVDFWSGSGKPTGLESFQLKPAHVEVQILQHEFCSGIKKMNVFFVMVDLGRCGPPLRIPDFTSFRMKTLEIHGFSTPNQGAGKIMHFCYCLIQVSLQQYPKLQRIPLGWGILLGDSVFEICVVLCQGGVPTCHNTMIVM
jgi:hypothetical protein